MRVGITLPQFRLDPEPAVAVARAAEEAGVDGVFVFDHLWPLGGDPSRPALHSLTLLGALAAETSTVALGTLVARVGVLPDAVLVHALETLHRMVGDRLIAAMGTGDSHNKGENLAYGIPFPEAAERLDRLRECCTAARRKGITTWAGGNSAAVRRVADESADAWNGWALSPLTFRAYADEVGVPVTWGGQVLVGRSPEEAADKSARYGTRPGLVSGTVDDLARHLDELADAGAEWAVCAPLDVGSDVSAVETVVMARDRVAGSGRR